MKANRHRSQLIGTEVSNVAGRRQDIDHESERNGQTSLNTTPERP